MMVEGRHTYLCVGGPADGRRYVSDQKRVEIFIPPHFSLFDGPSETVDIQATATLQTSPYTREVLRYGQAPAQVLYFWAPDDVPIGETLKRLFDHYRPNGEVG